MSDRESPSSADDHRRSRASLLEKLVIFQFSILIVFTSWAFGGEAPWVRQVIAAWGAVGVLLFISAAWLHADASGQRHPALRWLWPLLVYDLVVIAGCFNPSFKPETIAGTAALVMADPKPWLPSSARPVLALQELWHFNVIVLSSFNLVFVLRNRRVIRSLLFVLGVNAVVLAVFGTFQKLTGAAGLWFGLVHSPNPKFFSTFIYANHWGAFTLLNTAVCLGLVSHFVRRSGRHGFWHSPAPLGLLLTLLLAATIPLCGSRSSSALASVLLFGSLAHLLVRTIRHRRELRESAVLPVAGIVAAALVAAAAIAYLSRGVIAQRAHLTVVQFNQAVGDDTLVSRLVLYRDTWRMAMAKPWFGWGLESYPHVFRIFNTQRTVETLWWIPFYARAHNDWLQSLAETGFVGTSMLALLVFLPLRDIAWRRVNTILPRYLLAGNALILAYAWLEFPFANSAVLMTFC
ncbi:MAG TPA: O-antigen ligase family protein, partial [Candidatus Limnocylindria bacterium]|nr:O-antigen ligase family protein [Candidatus Limnocylindria bacterium]